MKYTTRFLWLCLVMSFVFSTNAFAQGMDFSEEDPEKEESAEGEEKVEGEGMDFDIDGDGEGMGKLSDGDMQSVAILALPGPNMSDELRAKVQAELDRFAATVTNIKPVSGDSVRSELVTRGDECMKEPICLGEVGVQAGVDRILVARVRADGDNLELATDYFDVEDRLFLKYDSVKGLSGESAVIEAIEPSLRIILEVRDLVETPDYHDDKSDGTIQRILAYSTAGLAVVSLGAGVYFGLEAGGLETELEESSKTEGIYNLTQKEGAEKLRDAESQAVTANIFYGLSAGFAIASGILFYIQGGNDVATQEELDASIKPTNFRFAPVVTKHGVGFGAGFDF